MIRPLVFELMQNGLRVRQLNDFPSLNQQSLDSHVILLKNNDFEIRYMDRYIDDQFLLKNIF